MGITHGGMRLFIGREDCLMEESVVKVLPFHLRREDQVGFSLYPDASLSSWSGAHVVFIDCSKVKHQFL